MNIRFALLCATLTTISSSFCFSTNKKELIALAKTVDAPLWKRTALTPTSDPALTLIPTLSTLPGLPATSTLFFMRTPVIGTLGDHLDITPLATLAEKKLDGEAFNELISTIDNISIQEHTVGMQLGQQWEQDSWELSWHWWIGMRERNLWLKNPARARTHEMLRTIFLKNDDEAPSHAPQQPQLGASWWHATALTPGIGDVHINARYRLPLGEIFSCSFGLHAVIPTGTHRSHKTPTDDAHPLPLETQPFALRLLNRARDILLCAPLGTSGHVGLGASAHAQLNLTPQLALHGEVTQVHFRPGSQRRFALATEEYIPLLSDGTDDTQMGVSSNGDLRSYLQQFVYPLEQHVTLHPGMIRTASTHLAYATPQVHCSLGYRREEMEGEHSQTAPLATLASEMVLQHQATFIGGLSSRHDWGEASSYFTAHYTFAGTRPGDWSVGFGATIQA